jgi:nucleoside-diphosphate-sugar epimerase
MIESGSGACNTTHVDNLVDAVFLAIESERAIGETFFITDGERITWGNFIQAHAQMFNPAPTLADVPKQQVVAYYRNQPGMWSSSLRAARRVLLGRDLRLLLLQIPLLKSASAPLWRSIESMSPVRKQRIKAILGSTNGHSNGACPPTIPFMPDEVDFATQTGTVFFAIDKARQVLGYEPRIRFQDGIRLVEQWLRFANYL